MSSLLFPFHLELINSQLRFEFTNSCAINFSVSSLQLLMRYVDDFLLITREVGVARQFLDTMQRGVAEYNCKINPAKTVTNFRVREDGGVEYFEDGESHTHNAISHCFLLS